MHTEDARSGPPQHDVAPDDTDDHVRRLAAVVLAAEHLAASSDDAERLAALLWAVRAGQTRLRQVSEEPGEEP